MTDYTRYRSEFPILGERTYLISASLGPLSKRARRAAEEHLDLWQRLGPEELWFAHGMPKLEQCRDQFSQIIGADPDEIAIVPSVSSASLRSPRVSTTTLGTRSWQRTWTSPPTTTCGGRNSVAVQSSMS